MPTAIFVFFVWLATPAQHTPPGQPGPATATSGRVEAVDAKVAAERRAAARAEAEVTVSKSIEAADPAIKIAACEATGATTPSCNRALGAAGRSKENLSRINELAEKSARGDTDAADELRRFTQQLKDKDPAAAIEALSKLEGGEGADTLRELTSSQKPEIRELAAAALATKDPDQARELVNQAMAGKGQADVAFQAAITLAGAGDAEHLARVSEWLPRLQGRDRLKAASALVKNGDAEGTRTLADIARSADDEMLRLQAASALIQIDPAAAEAAVSRALESENMWVRGEAAALAPKLGDQWIERVRMMLTDPNEWVRLKAAASVLNATRPR